MKTLDRTIRVNSAENVSSIWAVPDDYAAQGRVAAIIAHGAGNDMQHPFVSYVHEGLAKHGILTVKFNFPYKEHGNVGSDKPALLEATWRAMARAVRNDELQPSRLFFAGKSLGGRVATQVAAQGEPSHGVVLFGYPLHPANRTERLRAEHLAQVGCPMLFIEGTRDPMCDLGLLRAVLGRVPTPYDVHVIDEGDHSLKLPKHCNRDEASVWEEVVQTTAQWMLRVARS